jgi:hypothetical protein
MRIERVSRQPRPNPITDIAPFAAAIEQHARSLGPWPGTVESPIATATGFVSDDHVAAVQRESLVPVSLSREPPSRPHSNVDVQQARSTVHRQQRRRLIFPSLCAAWIGNSVYGLYT